MKAVTQPRGGAGVQSVVSEGPGASRRAEYRRRRAGRGFTLIELLVVIGVIGVLLGILSPVLSSVIGAGRRTKCLAHLKSIGVGLQIFQNTNKGMLPYALPLDASELPGGVSGGDAASVRPEDSILSRVGPLVDSMEVFICPSDDQVPPELDALPQGPIGAHNSYEYWAGWLMLWRELEPRIQDPRPAFTVTRFYEDDKERTFPVMSDSAARHKGGPVYDQNALYFGDWRAEWMSFNPAGDNDRANAAGQ